jgi:hypothetical protein
MTNKNENTDPKPGFGEDEKDDQNESGNQNDQPNKSGDRQDALEDTSYVNYGNIGQEGGVEDLEEED